MGSEMCIRDSLRGVDLRRANLRGANLRGANLQGANLGGANLENANIQRASLGGARLQRANLAGACLQETNLSHVKWDGLRVDGLPIGQLTFVPTPNGWQLTIDEWRGTLNDLRTVGAESCHSTGEKDNTSVCSKSTLEAVIALCEAHIANNPEAIEILTHVYTGKESKEGKEVQE